MSETNSFASLTPTLLARKGGAKPAMRPQVQPLHEFHEATARDMAEDLGWNDLGQPSSASLPPHVNGADVVSIVGDANVGSVVSGLPKVVRQQASLSDKLEVPVKPRKSAKEQGRRVAFTLRLDAERHLKLRLAGAVLNRSAQDIVTEALDNHLAVLAKIESFAEEIHRSR